MISINEGQDFENLYLQKLLDIYMLQQVIYGNKKNISSLFLPSLDFRLDVQVMTWQPD